MSYIGPSRKCTGIRSIAKAAIFDDYEVSYTLGTMLVAAHNANVRATGAIQDIPVPHIMPDLAFKIFFANTQATVNWTGDLTDVPESPYGVFTLTTAEADAIEYLRAEIKLPTWNAINAIIFDPCPCDYVFEILVGADVVIHYKVSSRGSRVVFDMTGIAHTADDLTIKIYCHSLDDDITGVTFDADVDDTIAFLNAQYPIKVTIDLNNSFQSMFLGGALMLLTTAIFGASEALASFKKPLESSPILRSLARQFGITASKLVTDIITLLAAANYIYGTDISEYFSSPENFLDFIVKTARSFALSVTVSSLATLFLGKLTPVAALSTGPVSALYGLIFMDVLDDITIQCEP
jgi:hypothetical protein